ncbi:MAG: hypothetical protein R3E39_29435 [Anaerolineae bacterium]
MADLALIPTEARISKTGQGTSDQFLHYNGNYEKRQLQFVKNSWQSSDLH